jgi:hypothetical protein
MLNLLIGTVLWLGFATAFVLWGLAWVLNWNSWADRYAAWNRATWGWFAMWSGSGAYTRFSGGFLVAFGLVLFYGFWRWVTVQVR